MKFGHKLTLVLLGVLALVLSLSTLWTQERQFSRALADLRQTAQEEWLRESAAFQRGLRSDTEFQLNSRAWSYLGSLSRQDNRSLLAVYDQEGQSLASTMPATLSQNELAQVVPGGEGTQIRLLTAVDGTRYLVCSGLIVCPEQCLTFVSAQSLSGLFADRALRLRDAVLGQTLALAVAALLALLFCRRMVRPLEQLNAASQEIAAGAYDRRTALPGSDEIAGLSRSFDEMAAAVQDKVNALQAHVQQREDFIAAFTHELRTPMTSILGYADLLRGAEVPAATRQKAADFIYHESKRLESLSGRLMELMQLNGNDLPSLEPVQLDGIFRQLTRALPHSPPLLTVPDCHLTVLAQRELLCDLLYNLVLNARHATPPEGTITLEVSEQPDGVALTVRDTGCGIPAEDLPHITEPFYMVDKSRARQQGGSGMGLALCERIAILHGTHLTFESTPGTGTAVTFTLPKPKEADHETA
ncbi:HAMP domain-containing sensor histidine kinase [uncultured Subdoligranulum sp.]|uniref:sensor histidine kinase n=1 Tax=uncultured Subdoligranulum sp. TaxID=512298 RepID=UPI002633CE0F|nr:HAMP domain-containing sensor histidine kinase [uncultured Subdoligranulum sp.]